VCGVCGIWIPQEQADKDPAEAARLMFFSLYALQHRGQESAGLAATDGADLRVVRRMGLVGQVFSEPDLAVLGGRAAMGHTRYSTTGASKIQNAQPFVVSDATLGELAIGHNGNCINAKEVRDDLATQGVHFSTSSDTEVVAQAIANAPGANLSVTTSGRTTSPPSITMPMPRSSPSSGTGSSSTTACPST